MAYDAADGYVLLFGGVHSSVLGDTWEFHSGAWTQLSTSSSPPARWLASMVYDAADGYVLLFGGYDGTSRLADTSEVIGGDWTQLSKFSTPSTPIVVSTPPDAAVGTVMLFPATTFTRSSEDRRAGKEVSSR